MGLIEPRNMYLNTKLIDRIAFLCAHIFSTLTWWAFFLPLIRPNCYDLLAHSSLTNFKYKNVFANITLYLLFIFVTFQSSSVTINAWNFIFCKLIKLVHSLSRSILFCDLYVTLIIRFLMWECIPQLYFLISP